MRRGLAKTKSRIQQDLLTGNALLPAGVCACAQKAGDLGHHIPVFGLLLHGVRRTLHVHQAHRHSQSDRHIDGARCLQGIDIIDQPCPGRHRRLHDLGLAGIDGQRHRKR